MIETAAIGSATLYCGDALEILPMLSGVNAVVTDPPFTATGGSTNGRSSEADGQFFQFWLSSVCTKLRCAVRPTGHAFMFCDWRTLPFVVRAWGDVGGRMNARHWKVTQTIVWDRESIGMGSPFRNSFEMIAFARGGDFSNAGWSRSMPNLIRERWPYVKHAHHGAEKPVGLLSQLCGHGDGTILDPFMGSGSTGVACQQIDRPFIGIEMERRYFDIACERIDQAQRQARLAI